MGSSIEAVVAFYLVISEDAAIPWKSLKVTRTRMEQGKSLLKENRKRSSCWQENCRDKHTAALWWRQKNDKCMEIWVAKN